MIRMPSENNAVKVAVMAATETSHSSFSNEDGIYIRDILLSLKVNWSLHIIKENDKIKCMTHIYMFLHVRLSVQCLPLAYQDSWCWYLWPLPSQFPPSGPAGMADILVWSATSKVLGWRCWGNPTLTGHTLPAVRMWTRWLPKEYISF